MAKEISDMPDCILTTHNLSFNSSLHFPNLMIPHWKTVFLAGPGGCGKSTLLKLFNATLPPSSGSILFHGSDITQMDTITLRRKIVLAGQSAYLFPGSIGDNFRIFHQYNEATVPEPSAMRQFLNICCLDFSPDVSCSILSEGERQRIFLAVTLSLKPEVLLLDEPFSMLDETQADHTMRGIVTFCRKNLITPVIVSHSRSLHAAYADKIIDLGGKKL